MFTMKSPAYRYGSASKIWKKSPGEKRVAEVVVLAMLMVGVPLMGWTLLHGLQTGTMDAAGVPYASYSRSKNPFLFWFATVFNVFALIVGTAFLLSGVL
jgi:hypothetical protein